MDQSIIKSETLQKMVNVLVTLPYSQVAGLLAEVQANSQPMPEPEPEEITEE
jgi:hypothetical protein